MKKINIKNNKGITLATLVVTIIVLLIITSITVYQGNNTIRESKLQNLKTNMLLIQAKTKEFAENTNFEIGNKTEESEIAPIKEKNLVGTKIEASQLPNDIYVDTSKGDLYRLSQQNLNDMGLSKIEITNDNYYVVQYDIENIKVDVINTEGYKLDGKMYYSLSQMEKDGV